MLKRVAQGRILRLAVPNAMAAISTPLIGIADTAMIGHLPDVALLGAVATASVIFDVLFWGTGFLRMGTTALVAQHHGAGDRRSCAETLCRSLIIAVVLGSGMVVLQEGIAAAGFTLAGGGARVQLYGRQYFAVRVLSAPLVLAMITLNGFFLGTANSLAPLCVTMVANLANIGADYVLIFGKLGAPQLGILGAAWAAVLGNASAVLVGVGILGVRYAGYFREPLGRLLAREELRRTWHTNIHLLGRTLCLLAAQVGMLGMASRMGAVPLAANAVVWQLWSLVSYGVDGFAHAAETLVGNALGSREYGHARRYAALVIRWGLLIGVVFGLLYLAMLSTFARLFTTHGEVILAVTSLTWIVALIQPINAVVFVLDGVLIGAADMRYLFKAMAVATIGVFMPLAFLCVSVLDWGLPGAWLAYDGLMAARLLTLLWRYRRDIWLRSFLPRHAGAAVGSAH